MRLIRRQLAAFSVYTVPTHLARFLQPYTLCMRYRMDNSRRWSTKYRYFTGQNICGAFKNSVKVPVQTYESTPVCIPIWTPKIQSWQLQVVIGIALVAIKYLPSKKASGCFVGGLPGFWEVWRLAFVKKEDWKILKILNVKTEDFKIV